MTEATQEPALGISVNVTVGESRSIVFQSFVPRDADQATVNGLLDRIMAAADRQQAKAKVPDLRAQLAAHKKNLVRLGEDMERIEQQTRDAYETSGKRGAFKLGTKEQAAKDNTETTRKRFQEEIERIEREISEAEAAGQ